MIDSTAGRVRAWVPAVAAVRVASRASRTRPWQAVAVAETAGDVGSGGRLAEASGERHGSVTDVRPRHRDAENVTLPPVFFRRYEHVTMV